MPDSRYRTSLPRRDPLATTSAVLGSLPSGYLQYGPLAPTQPQMAGPALGAGAEAAGGDGADGAAASGGGVCTHANSNPDKSTVMALLFILCFRRKIFGASHYRGGIGSL